MLSPFIVQAESGSESEGGSGDSGSEEEASEREERGEKEKQRTASEDDDEDQEWARWVRMQEKDLIIFSHLQVPERCQQEREGSEWKIQGVS